MSVARIGAGLLCLCLALVPTLSEAQRAPTGAQILAMLDRAERQLAAGQPSRAVRTARPALSALTWSGAGYTGFDNQATLERAELVSYSSVVRLGGRTTVDGTRSTDPRRTLLRAEEYLRALARNGDPLRVARHSEALVALGDRMPEAFGILAGLHTQGRLTEAEGYAALVLSARATGHADVAQTASERCAALARSRARRVCPR